MIVSSNLDTTAINTIEVGKCHSIQWIYSTKRNFYVEIPFRHLDK